jgi:Cu+-exporting ATPase
MATIAGKDPAGAVAEPERAVDLTIGGMTCASCAARIQKKLNKLAGVTATVNYATEKARVSFPAAVTPEDLIKAVERTGYTAALSAPLAARLAALLAASPSAASPAAGAGASREEAEPD